jgi:predicted component of type VI protein secretion system
MKLSLLVLTPGKLQGKTIDIPVAQFIIGRDPQCHLRPASPLISKRHCALIQREGKAFIRDFESTNGTLVNEEPIEGERELHHDDQLKIGPMLFAVRVDATATAPKPTGQTPPPATRPATPAPKPAAAAPAAPTPPPSQATRATPTPTTKPTSAPTAASSDDEDLMSMLLSAGDDAGSEGVGSDGGAAIPDGSTVHDLPAVGTGDKPGEAKKEDSKDKKAAANSGNTSAAAASLLEKLTRRPRT